MFMMFLSRHARNEETGDIHYYSSSTTDDGREEKQAGALTRAGSEIERGNDWFDLILLNGHQRKNNATGSY